MIDLDTLLLTLIIFSTCFLGLFCQKASNLFFLLRPDILIKQKAWRISNSLYFLVLTQILLIFLKAVAKNFASHFFHLKSYVGRKTIHISLAIDDFMNLDHCLTDTKDMWKRDLVPLVQFKKHEKHPWMSVTFSKTCGVTKSNTSPWMFFTFFNL